MKKTVFTLLTLLSASAFVAAQTVDDGIKYLYYQRIKSAKETFQKLISADPKNVSAIYWMGQALLTDKDINGARAIYQQALDDGVNDPFIWIGMGHVELFENNINSAKQRFEAAITATKGKKGVENADILNAVGRANADGSSTKGDPLYGIEKLKRAAATDLKNPDIDINLGRCYLKLGNDHGGEAVEAFTDAAKRNPKYAQAYYLMGKVYQAQNNKESMDEQYGKAIDADPAFAPVYLQYFLYYQNRDVNVAKEYLDKFIANADKDCTTEFFVADYLFRAGKYKESLAKAKEMENGECKTYERINVIYAYDYDRLGDSIEAKSHMDAFFDVTPTERIQPDDYVFVGKLYAKVPGSEDVASIFLTKAFAADTTKLGKIEIANIAIAMMAKAGKIRGTLMWLGKKNSVTGGNISESDYYKLGTAATNAIALADSVGRANNDTTQGMMAYMLADSIAKAYIATYPDKPQGYDIRVLAAKKADRDTTLGLALEPISQQNEYLMKNLDANRKKIFVNYYYLLLYYTSSPKDLSKLDGYKKGIENCDLMLQLYPDSASEENQFGTQTKNALEGSVKKFQQGQPKGGNN